MGTDLDGAASGLSAGVAGIVQVRGSVEAAVWCQHLGPEVLASARGWQTPQAVAREAEQAADTGQDPTCPAQHPIPPSRRCSGRRGSRQRETFFRRHTYYNSINVDAYMKLSQFAFDLPQERIATEPVRWRDEARLMVLHKDTGEIEHRIFKDIVD